MVESLDADGTGATASVDESLEEDGTVAAVSVDESLVADVVAGTAAADVNAELLSIGEDNDDIVLIMFPPSFLHRKSVAKSLSVSGKKNFSENLCY